MSEYRPKAAAWEQKGAKKMDSVGNETLPPLSKQLKVYKPLNIHHGKANGREINGRLPSVSKSNCNEQKTHLQSVINQFRSSMIWKGMLLCNNNKHLNGVTQVVLRKMVKENPNLFEISGNRLYFRPKIVICKDYKENAHCSHENMCSALHICFDFLFGLCTSYRCSAIHYFGTYHNKRILGKFYMENFSSEDVNFLIRYALIGNVNAEDLELCVDYDTGKCANEICIKLHLCSEYLVECAKFIEYSCTDKLRMLNCPNEGKCLKCHYLNSGHNKRVFVVHYIPTFEDLDKLIRKILSYKHISSYINALPIKEEKDVLGKFEELLAEKQNNVHGPLSMGEKCSSSLIQKFDSLSMTKKSTKEFVHSDIGRQDKTKSSEIICSSSPSFEKGVITFNNWATNFTMEYEEDRMDENSNVVCSTTQAMLSFHSNDPVTSDKKNVSTLKKTSIFHDTLNFECETNNPYESALNFCFNGYNSNPKTEFKMLNVKQISDDAMLKISDLPEVHKEILIEQDSVETRLDRNIPDFNSTTFALDKIHLTTDVQESLSLNNNTDQPDCNDTFGKCDGNANLSNSAIINTEISKDCQLINEIKILQNKYLYADCKPALFKDSSEQLEVNSNIVSQILSSSDDRNSTVKKINAPLKTDDHACSDVQPFINTVDLSENVKMIVLKHNLSDCRDDTNVDKIIFNSSTNLEINGTGDTYTFSSPCESLNMDYSHANYEHSSAELDCISTTISNEGFPVTDMKSTVSFSENTKEYAGSFLKPSLIESLPAIEDSSNASSTLTESKMFIMSSEFQEHGGDISEAEINFQEKIYKSNLNRANDLLILDYAEISNLPNRTVSHSNVKSKSLEEIKYSEILSVFSIMESRADDCNVGVDTLNVLAAKNHHSAGDVATISSISSNDVIALDVLNQPIINVPNKITDENNCHCDIFKSPLEFKSFSTHQNTISYLLSKVASSNEGATSTSSTSLHTKSDCKISKLTDFRKQICSTDSSSESSVKLSSDSDVDSPLYIPTKYSNDLCSISNSSVYQGIVVSGEEIISDKENLDTGTNKNSELIRNSESLMRCDTMTSAEEIQEIVTNEKIPLHSSTQYCELPINFNKNSMNTGEEIQKIIINGNSSRSQYTVKFAEQKVVPKGNSLVRCDTRTSGEELNSDEVVQKRNDCSPLYSPIKKIYHNDCSSNSSLRSATITDANEIISVEEDQKVVLNYNLQNNFYRHISPTAENYSYTSAASAVFPKCKSLTNRPISFSESQCLEMPKNASFSHNMTVNNSKTIWSYEIIGNTEIAEICYDSVEKLCSKESMGCPRLHSTDHYHWQVKDPNDMWCNLPKDIVTFLEIAYCNVNLNNTTLPRLNPSQFIVDPKYLIMLLGRFIWTANFNTMVITNSSNNTLLIRRLCSEPNSEIVVDESIFLWYFLNSQNEWIEYGCNDYSGFRRTKSNITSVDMETHFKNTPQLLMYFHTELSQYYIAFSELCQVNRQSLKTKKIRRRPKFHLNKETNLALPDMSEDVVTLEIFIRVALMYESKKFIIFDKKYWDAKLPYIVLDIESIKKSYLWVAFQKKLNDINATKGCKVSLSIKYLNSDEEEKSLNSIPSDNVEWRLYSCAEESLFSRKNKDLPTPYAKVAWEYCKNSPFKCILLAKVPVQLLYREHHFMNQPMIYPGSRMPFNYGTEDVPASLEVKENVEVENDDQQELSLITVADFLESFNRC